MLEIGHALNTIQGNIHFLKGNVEVVFSGAVNTVDYIIHDEKTLGEVIGQFTADATKGIVAGIVAQGITVLIRGVITTAFVTPPTAVMLGVFTVFAFVIGGLVSDLDRKHEFSKPMKEKVERLLDED